MDLTPTRGVTRFVRCAAVGVTSGVLAAVAHTGELPSPPLLVTLALGAGWLAKGFASRERRPWEILALVGGIQVAAHILLSLRHLNELVPTPTMAAGHILATLLTVAALAGAEQAVFRLAALASVLPRKLTPPLASAALRIPIAPHPLSPVPDALRALPRRGPPAHS